MERTTPAVDELDADAAEREVAALAAVLQACVAQGASVNFIHPFTQGDAEAWWRAKVLPALARGERRLLAARDNGGSVVGTAQLELVAMPNQRHRAEVSKVLVHPGARRRGIARALMLRLEGIAREEGRALLTLDTVAGSAAQPLYASLGYALAGVVPRYARAAAEARLEDTAIMFKELAPAG